MWHGSVSDGQISNHILRAKSQIFKHNVLNLRRQIPISNLQNYPHHKSFNTQISNLSRTSHHFISLFATSAADREKKKVKTHKSAEKLQQFTTMIINSISK